MLVLQRKGSDRSPLKVTLNEQGPSKGDKKGFPREEKASSELVETAVPTTPQHMLWCTAAAWGWAGGLLEVTTGSKAAGLGTSLPQ